MTPFPNQITGLKNRSLNCSQSLLRYLKTARGFQYGLLKSPFHIHKGTWRPAWISAVNAPIHVILTAPDRLRLLKQGLCFYDQHHIVQGCKMDPATATRSTRVGLNCFLKHGCIRGGTYIGLVPFTEDSKLISEAETDGKLIEIYKNSFFYFQCPFVPTVNLLKSTRFVCIFQFFVHK